MDVFAFWPFVFRKYVFVLLEYGLFLKNVFSYFKKSYLNISMCKYVHKITLHPFYTYLKKSKICQRIHTYEYV